MNQQILTGTPAAGVSVLILFGVPLSQWVLLVTLIYTLFLIYILIRDKIWNKTDKKNLEVLHKEDEREHAPVVVPDDEDE